MRCALTAIRWLLGYPAGPLPAEHTIAPDLAGQTVAKVIRRLLPGTSWNKARDLCRSGRVWLDGVEALDPAARVAAGERLRLDPTGPRRDRRPGAVAEILHLDSHVVVAVKPAGVMTVPYDDGDTDTLVHRVTQSLRRRGGAPRPRVVQRLDKETSGVLVFARSRRAERELQRQLRSHAMGRVYLGIAHGRVRAATHDTELARNRGDGLRGTWGLQFSTQGRRPGDLKRAITHVDSVQHLVGATLVSCRLETGRTHQIRIHLSEAGNPLVGERVYIRELPQAQRLSAPRVMLHAQRITFAHPETGDELTFEAPPPDDFAATLERLRP